MLQRDQILSETRSTRTERQRQRAALFDAYPGMAFATDMVFRMVQLEYYGLLDAALGDNNEVVYQFLESADFGRFLLSEAAIRHYAAQAANQVWFLYQLGWLICAMRLYSVFKTSIRLQGMLT
nr:DUF3541 domain-containing protein [Nitrincola sp. A-D6]